MKVIYVITLTLLLFYSCSDNQKQPNERKKEEVTTISQEQPSFTILFPEKGFEVKSNSKRSESNPEFDFRSMKMEGRNENGAFFFFVNQDGISKVLQERLSEDEEMDNYLNGVLSGSISNINAENLTFRKIDLIGFHGLEARRVVKSENYEGIAKYRAFSDGLNLFIIGAAGQNYSDVDVDEFLNSFRIIR